MIGTSTPRPRTLRTISGTAAAASSLFTVTRTSSLPAWARRATWIAVASASAVSVFVIDWTTTGGRLPTGTPPTSTFTDAPRREPAAIRLDAGDRIEAVSAVTARRRTGGRCR